MKILTKADIYRVVPHDVVMDILSAYRFDMSRSEHGIGHWGRVIENGLLLAERNKANVNVIIAFGLFHDCQRHSEYEDPQHGPRGGKFMRVYADRLALTADDLEKAVAACEGHTHIIKSDDVDIATCWDADRLDLMRVGIYPEMPYLNNTDILDETWLKRRSQPAIFNLKPPWVTDILADYLRQDAEA